MPLMFDKSNATSNELWVDSITGYTRRVFSTNGMLNRGSIKILAQKFHTQDLNYGQYHQLELHLDTTQIDELIQILMKLKDKMP